MKRELKKALRHVGKAFKFSFDYPYTANVTEASRIDSIHIDLVRLLEDMGEPEGFWKEEV